MTDRYALFGQPLGHSKSPHDPRRVRAADGPGPHLRGHRGAGRRVRRRRRPLPGGRRARLQRHAAVQARRVRLRDRADGARPPRRRGQLHEVRGRPRHGRELRRPRPRQTTSSATWAARSVAAACSCSVREARPAAPSCPSSTRSPQVLDIENRTVAKAKALGDQFATQRNSRHGRAIPTLPGSGSTSWLTRRPRASAVSCRMCPRRLRQGVPRLRHGLRQGADTFPGLARDEGAGRLADGIGMLIEQAAEAFLWWRGVRPRTAAMIEKLSVPLV